MAVIALISDKCAIEIVLPWASAFARSRDTSLSIVCWTYSPLVNPTAGDESAPELVLATRAYIDEQKIESTDVVCVSGPSEMVAVNAIARKQAVGLLIAAASDQSGLKGSIYSSNKLLKQSPFNTVILFGGTERSKQPNRIFVGATDNANDTAALFLASRLGQFHKAGVTVARAESETEREDIEVARRELRHLIRDAGVEEGDRIKCEVVQVGDYDDLVNKMNEYDLVLFGANCRFVPLAVGLTTRPAVAVVKRAPPLRLWQSANYSLNWKAKLSPADYAELIQGLRHGSRMSTDFFTMLSLATVVASMGLLQNSPAVVIGSMLLAPLMTPMIGCGLALAQANRDLGNRALGAVIAGSLCTLGISFLIGILVPGDELTPQIYARGEPTALDLAVALASAAAAAYALARPNLVGSIAGVAIATALVPPLCSIGLSVAYGDLGNAWGATLLFVTNFLAIVLSAALTFRIIGITAKQIDSRRRRWAFGTAGVMCVAVIVIFVPLQQALLKSIVETKPQPRAFPLAKSVIEAIEDRIESEPDVSLITAGRPSSQRITSDVVLVLGAVHELDSQFADELVKIVRHQMDNESLVVEVHCVKVQWHSTPK